MKDEEIKAEMAKYTEALKKDRPDLFDNCNTDDEDELQECWQKTKEDAHKIAMECLNKILTPELKVFVKNLCLDRLQYPDDPIFYKVFGDQPQVGDKISEDELKKLGITWSEFSSYAYDIWMQENSCFIWEKEIDGRKYWVIEDLYETDSEETKERREWLKNSSRLKRELAKFSNDNEVDVSKIFDLLNKATPMIGKLGLQVWVKMVKGIIEQNIIHNLFGKGKIIGYDGKFIAVDFENGKHFLFKYPNPQYKEYFVFCDGEPDISLIRKRKLKIECVKPTDLKKETFHIPDTTPRSCPECGDCRITFDGLRLECPTCGYILCPTFKE